MMWQHRVAAPLASLQHPCCCCASPVPVSAGAQAYGPPFFPPAHLAAMPPSPDLPTLLTACPYIEKPKN